jgi:hypothetical protein
MARSPINRATEAEVNKPPILCRLSGKLPVSPFASLLRSPGTGPKEVESAKTADTGEIVGFLRPHPAMAASGQRRPPSDASAECLAPGGKWLQELSYQRAWQFGDRSLTTADVRAAGPFPRRRFETRWNPPRSNPG